MHASTRKVQKKEKNCILMHVETSPLVSPSSPPCSLWGEGNRANLTQIYKFNLWLVHGSMFSFQGLNKSWPQISSNLIHSTTSSSSTKVRDFKPLVFYTNK